MISKLKLFFLLTIFRLYQSVDEFSCFDGSPGGFYCTNDRLGYFNCNQDRNGNPINRKQLCPTGTQCSCFINTKCEVEESKICQSLKKPFLPGSYDMTYSLNRTISSPAGTKKIMSTERIIENNDLKKRFTRTYDRKTNEQSFIIVEKSSQHVLKFEGKYSDSCSLKILKKFPPPIINVDEFQLTKKEGNIETYEFKIGSRNLGQSAVVKTLTLKVVGEIVTPLKFEVTTSGSAASKTSSRTIVKILSFFVVKREPEFFRVPSFCNNKRH